MIIIVSNKRRIIGYLVWVIFAILCLASIKLVENKSITAFSGSQKAYIAIVIDDFGNNSEGTEEMLNLPVKFTGAVMPAMPFTEKESDLLFDYKKDVILHMPMEAHTGKRSWLGPTPILNEYSPEKAAEIFSSSLNQINHRIGFNNHMGSKIMENEQILDAVFKIAENENLIFVDSMTTSKSKGKEIAEKYGIKYLGRDVFLDSTQDLSKVQENMRKAGKIALDKGYAVAIGHVGAEGGKVTAKAILNTYKELEEQGIEFVGVSDLANIIYGK